MPYGYLVPVRALAGVKLDLFGVGVGDRLRNVNLSIEPSQLMAITGQSGAGKSTLVKALVTTLPYSGRILVGGVDSRKSNNNIGYVSQDKTVFR